ncbi:Hypothetical_protein [Hexamita inflata]|uniref:Hypothetical_protein n=1 Tax=Hexamita inflata TaxID=28002 RepID=A0ABP1JXN1_9EUKA
MNNQELLQKLVGLQSLFKELDILDVQMQQKQEVYTSTKFQHSYTQENSQFQELLDGNYETIQEETINLSFHQHQKYVPKLSSAQKKAGFAEAYREAHISQLQAESKNMMTLLGVLLIADEIACLVVYYFTQHLKKYYKARNELVQVYLQTGEQFEFTVREVISEENVRRNAEITHDINELNVFEFE